MASIVLTAVGGGVGSMFGDWKTGAAVGNLLAGVLFPEKLKGQSRGKLDDLKVSGSQYGAMIPQVYAAGRVGANLVWVKKDSSGNHLVESSRNVRTGGKGGSRQTTRVYSYSATFAYLVCRGPVSGIRRIWFGDKVVYDSASADPNGKYNITVYTGTETQSVDATIEAAEGTGNWTAYRGYCYFVAKDIDLSEWGNQLPPASVELLPGAYSATIANDANCLAYYRFEDSPGLLLDSGPSGYTLSESTVGVATQTTGPTDLGEALRFGTGGAGAHLYRTLGDLSRWKSAQLTVEAWARYKGSGSESVQIRYANAGDTDYSFNLAFATSGGGTVDATCNVTAGFGIGPSVLGSVIDDGSWHHVAVTYRGGGRWKMYLDGAVVDDIPAPFASLTFTGASSDRLKFEDGSFDLDEVAIYDRELTATEIAARFAKTGTVLLSTILTDVFGQVGLTSSQYSVATGTDQVAGFVIGQRQELRSAIAELLLFYQGDLVEIDGQIKLVKRGGASGGSIADGDLGARLWDGPEETSPPKVTVRRIPDLELPVAVDFQYLSQTADYAEAQASAIRYTKRANTLERLTVSVPLVLAEADARQGAERILYQQWIEREQYQFVLGPKYLALAPGDVRTLPVFGATKRIRLLQLDEQNGLIACVAAQDSADILTQTASGATLTAPYQIPAEAGSTTLVAFSPNGLRDADTESIGFYVAANGPSGSDWPGAQLYMSRDGGTTYQELELLTDGATIGETTSTLADSGNWQTWDVTSTVDITVTTGSAPQTASDAEVLAGANAVRIGSEVLQFATVTSLGGSSYRLSRLLRGRRGTEQSMSGHSSGETVVFLQQGSVVRINTDLSLVGKVVSLKAVTIGKTLADASAVTLTITGSELKPYAPTHITGSRDGSSNLTITWQNRTRRGGEWRDLGDVEQPEDTLDYSIDILSAPGGSVLRTLTATTESVLYSAADQVTDFGSAQASVAVKVYQVSAAVGRGYPGTASV